MNALIICGGSGQGLRPVTCSGDELMIKIMGKSVLGYMAENLTRHGFDNIGVLPSMNTDEMQDYIEDFYVQNTEIYCAERIGNGSVFSAVKEFAKKQTEPFVLICSPCVTDIDLSKVLLYHRSIRADVTVVCSSVSEPEKYGIVNLARNGSVESLFEKPDWSHTSSDLADTGIYIIEPSVFDIFRDIEHFDFINEFLSSVLKSDKKLYGYQSENYWHNVKDHSDLRKIIRDLMQYKVDVSLPASRNGVFFADKVPDGDYSIVPPVYFGRNVKIGSNCTIGPFTIIEDNVITGDSSRIKRSFVMRNCHIGTNCDVTGSIIGKNCVLKKNSAYLEGCLFRSK